MSHFEIDEQMNESAENDRPHRVRIVFQPAGRQGEVEAGTTLLDAARSLGVEIESICGGHQTCGKCRVALETGSFPKFDLESNPSHVSPAGEREQSYARRHDFEPDMRLSCACRLEGDLLVRVPEESQTRKQVVRKAAGVERKIEVDAPMRLFYVELPDAHLKDHRGDWERLRDTLSEVHHLHDLRIDPAILPMLQPALAAAGRTLTVTVLSESEVIQIRPGFHDTLYGMAFDVGTTTIAGHLCHLRTGEILATVSRMNPQFRFGEDLMSRVSYGMMHEDGAQRMHETLIDALNQMVEEASAHGEIEPQDVVEMVVVGNTTMHHLLLGIDPRELGGSPFSLAVHDAIDIKARDLGLKLARGANLHVPPCEAGHVGADNVAVLVAEAPFKQDKQMLVIDIGTNGEILLGNRHEMLSASSPTGPAFEGAQIVHGTRAAPGAIERVRIDGETLQVRYRIIGNEEWIESLPEAPEVADEADSRRKRREEILNPPLRATGICGSGIIEAIAELFSAGVLGGNGRFAPIDHPRLLHGRGEGGGKSEFILAYGHETSSGRPITVHSDDVRAIQLGKAALYAGTRLLMKRLKVESVDRIVLAGGFGSYINPLHAMILGLIPDADLSEVEAVGNAAGDGARMILLDRGKREEAHWAARWVRYVETAVEPTFQEEFVAALHLPHARDEFPHLRSHLSERRALWDDARVKAIASLEQSGRTDAGARAARRKARARRRANNSQE